MSEEALDRYFSSPDLPIALYDHKSNERGDTDHETAAQEAINRCDAAMNGQ
jgi:hypothetical protein